MRRTDPLILGAGPAGCAAAITLARAGARPLLIDRDAAPRDPLCGGFLSWRTAERLAALGIEVAALGAQRVEELAIHHGAQSARVRLPGPSWGLSRHALDSALRRVALAQGADLAVERIRRIDGPAVYGESREWRADSVFLASGKHDLPGAGRPRPDADPALGLRLRLPPDPVRTRLIGNRIELHLFRQGYAGIVLQEHGGANVCLALRKSLLGRAGGAPRALLARLAAENPAFAARLEGMPGDAAIESIGAVPYGWIARETCPGRFRLGDQAAVVPSLAGEGIAFALASGTRAARAWLDGGPAAAPYYQRDFARRARLPVALAGLLWRQAERDAGARWIAASAARWPALARIAARLTRIA